MAGAQSHRSVLRTHPGHGKSETQGRLFLADRLALSPAEAARALGVSERHLRSILGELPHTHLGNRIVIPVDSLREWLKERARAEDGRIDRAVEECLRDLQR
jgi:excisionase family DNA binding protein